MSKVRDQLKTLLESDEAREALQNIFNEVTSKRSVTIRDSSMICPRCKAEHDLDWKIFPAYEAYALKDVIAFLSLALAYGVGKPPEEKNVNVHVTARRIEDATDEELEAIIEGRAVALPPG